MRVTLMCAAIALAVPATAAAQAQSRATIRFAEMDRNGDGVITRAEWRGSDRAFRAHDWNNDGILSGDELRPGARRNTRADDQAVGTTYRDDEFDDWTVEGFNRLDRNGDNRITRDEWRFNADTFARADHNGDGVISRAEFLGTDIAGANRRSNEPPADLFASVDSNGNGTIERNEWRWSEASFDERDANRDGRLSPEEFGRTAATRSLAYRSGYDRGLSEGRAAGREDHDRNQGWDLEGQRELETADSGFEARLGSRAEYQAGYREGFRRGYREGFGR